MKRVTKMLLFMICAIFTGCVTLYQPGAINSPCLQTKNEINTSAAIGISGCGLFNLQGSYATSDHMGLLADALYHNRQYHSTSSSIENLNIYSLEAGTGYFMSFGANGNGLFQCYGGIGYGNSNDRINDTTQSHPEISSQYLNVFLQPGIAFVNKNVTFSFDNRINYVNLFQIHAYLFDQFEWWNTSGHFHSDTTLQFVIAEPTITLKAGGKSLKGVFQLGLTLPIVNPEAYMMANTSSLLLVPLIKCSLGLSYSFGKGAKAE